LFEMNKASEPRAQVLALAIVLNEK